MTTSSLGVCLLLLIATTAAQKSANNTKWSSPVAERRSGDWVPLSAPCPTCRHSDVSAQASDAINSALPAPQHLPSLQFQQQQQVAPANSPLFPQQPYLQQQRPLSPAQQQFLQQQLLMTQLLQQANNQQFIQQQPILMQQLQGQLPTEGQKIYLTRQPNSLPQVNLPQELIGNPIILDQSRLLAMQHIQTTPLVDPLTKTPNSAQSALLQNPTVTQVAKQTHVQQPIPSPATVTESVESDEEEEIEEPENEEKEEVQLLYVPVETLRQRNRLPQQKQKSIQYQEPTQQFVQDSVKQQQGQQQQNNLQRFSSFEQQQQQPQQHEQQQILLQSGHTHAPQQTQSLPEQQQTQQRHRFQNQRRQQEQQRQTQQYEPQQRRNQQFESKQRRRPPQEQQRQQSVQYDQQQRQPQQYDQPRQSQQYDQQGAFPQQYENQQQRLHNQEQRFQQVNKYLTTTPNPIHQPPLSVFMDKLGHDVKLTDVINALRGTKTISVLDEVSPNSPSIFVGPSNLNTPDGYAKFEIPYLSALESNRVERKVDKLPFFVAPLSFQPPAGYSKIPFPAPHVGSVVVANLTEKTDVHEKFREIAAVKPSRGQYSLPADLPPINPELPSLVNSLQDSRQPGNVVLVPAREPSAEAQHSLSEQRLLQQTVTQNPNIQQQLVLSQQTQIPLQQLEISTQLPVRTTFPPVRATQQTLVSTQAQQFQTLGQNAAYETTTLEATLLPAHPTFQKQRGSQEQQRNIQLTQQQEQQRNIQLTQQQEQQRNIQVTQQQEQQRNIQLTQQQFDPQSHRHAEQPHFPADFQRPQLPSQQQQLQVQLHQQQPQLLQHQLLLEQQQLQLQQQTLPPPSVDFLNQQQGLQNKQRGLPQQTFGAHEGPFQRQLPENQQQEQPGFEIPQPKYRGQAQKQDLAIQVPQTEVRSQPIAVQQSPIQSQSTSAQAGILAHQAGIQTLQAGLAIQEAGITDEQPEAPVTVTEEPRTTSISPVRTTPSRRGHYRGRQRGTVPTYGTTTTTSTTTSPRRQYSRGRRPTHSRHRSEDSNSFGNVNQVRTRLEVTSTTPVSLIQTTQQVPINPNLPSDSYLDEQSQFQLQNDDKKIIISAAPTLQQSVNPTDLDSLTVHSQQATLLNEPQNVQDYLQYSSSSTTTTTTTEIPAESVQQAQRFDDSFQSQRFGTAADTGRRGGSSRNQRLRGRNQSQRQRLSHHITSTTEPALQRRPSFIQYTDTENTSTLDSIHPNLQQESSADRSEETLLATDLLTRTQPSTPAASVYSQQPQIDTDSLTTTESAPLYQSQEPSVQHQISQPINQLPQILNEGGEPTVQYDQLPVQPLQHQHRQDHFALQYEEQPSTQYSSTQYYHTTEPASAAIVQQSLQEQISDSPITEAPVDYSSTSEDIVTTLRQVPKHTTFQRTRGRGASPQKSTQSTADTYVDGNSFLSYQQPSEISPQPGGFRHSQINRINDASVETPRSGHSRLRGRIRGRQRTNHQQQETDNYPVTTQTAKPATEIDSDAQLGFQYQTIRSTGARQSSQAHLDSLSQTATQSTADYSYVTSEKSTQTDIQQEEDNEKANIGLPVLLNSPNVPVSFTSNDNTYSSTTAQKATASVNDYTSTTESAPVYKTGGRKGLAGRGHVRRPNRPTTPPTSAAITTPAPNSNKIYTVRPPKRPQQQVKITSVRGRIRRPPASTTTTTTEEFPSFPTAEPDWGRQQAFRFTPSAASNEVYDNGADDSASATAGRNSAHRQNTNSRGRGSGSRRPAYQPAFISNIGQIKEHSTESNYYQFGSLDEEETNDSPQWSSQNSQQQGVLLNFQHSASQGSSYDQAPLATNQQTRFEEYDSQEGAESQWSSSRLQFTDSQATLHSNKTSGVKEESDQNVKTAPIEDLIEINGNISSPEDNNEQSYVPAFHVEHNIEVNNVTNVSNAEVDQSSYTLTTENGTSEKKVAHGRRRGNWVRVRARQRTQDILETAESQNVASVTNILPGTPAKDSVQSSWVLFNVPEQENSKEDLPALNEYGRDDTLSGEEGESFYDSTQNETNYNLKSKEVYPSYGDYFDEFNIGNSTLFEEDAMDSYLPEFTEHNISKSNTTDFNVTQVDQLPNKNIGSEEKSSSWDDGQYYPKIIELLEETTSDESNVSDISHSQDNKTNETTTFDSILDELFSYEEPVLEENNSIPFSNDTSQRNESETVLQQTAPGIDDHRQTNSSTSNESHEFDKGEERDVEGGAEEEDTYEGERPFSGSALEPHGEDTYMNENVNISSDNLPSHYKSHGESESTVEDINDQDQEPIFKNFVSRQIINLEGALPNENDTSEISNSNEEYVPKHREYQSHPPRFRGTSTSTEVSHETEICYRGRCIKTKTPEVDQAQVE